MSQQRETLYERISAWLLIGATIVLPIIVIPATEQIIFHAKIYGLIILALLLLAIFAFRSIKKRVISLTASPLLAPLFIFGLIVLISSFVSSDYPVRNLLDMGGVWLAAMVIAILGSSLVKSQKVVTQFLYAFWGINVILLLSSLLQLFGMGPAKLITSFFPGELPQTLVFNIAGSSLVALEIAVIGLIGLVFHVMNTKKLRPLELGLGLCLVLSIALHGWSLLPGQVASPILLPFTANWSMVADLIKAPKTALLGAGPANFGLAYNQLKPVWLNQAQYWSLVFNQGTNVPLTLLVTIGIVGSLIWFFLGFLILKLARQTTASAKPLSAMLITSFLLALLVPFSPLMIGLQSLLIAFWLISQRDRFPELEIYGLTVRVVKESHEDQPLTLYGRTLLYGIGGALLLLTVFLFYGIGRAYAAEMALLNASKASIDNNGVGIYTNLQKAVTLNPYLDYIRRRYAITNIQIASVLSQKTDPTDADKQQFSQLVQQAIREGKAATLLEPKNSDNWLVLAQIYRTLVGAADGADQWTINAYVSAIQTNPSDPNARIELGGVFYSQKQYTEAAQLFQQAANLKPDLPNAHYNLANALRESQNYAAAKVAYEQTLSLLPTDSDDYGKAQKELQEVTDALAKQEAAAKSQQNTQTENNANTTENTNAQTPSLLQQNVNSAPTETVNNPPTEPLDVSPETQQLLENSDL